MFNLNKLTKKLENVGKRGRSTEDKDDKDGKDSGEGFLCPTCYTAFPTSEQLQDHYNTAHAECLPETTSVNCPACKMNFGSEIEFQSHYSRHHAPSQEQVGLEISRMAMSSLSQEKTAWKESTEILQKKMDDMLQEKVEIVSENKMLKEKVVVLEGVIKKQTLATEKSQSENSELKLKSSLNEKKIKELEAEIQQRPTADDVEVLKKEIIKVQKIMNDTTIKKEKDYDALKKEYDELQQIHSLNSQRNCIQMQTIKERDKTLEKLNQELTDVKKACDKHKDYYHLTEKLQISDAKSVRMSKDLAECKKQNCDLIEKLEEKEREIIHRKNEMDTIVNKFCGDKGPDVAVNQLKEEIGHLMNEVENYKSEVKSLKSDLKQSQEQLSEAESEITESNLLYEEQTLKVQRCERVVQGFELANEKLQSDLDNMKEEVNIKLEVAKKQEFDVNEKLSDLVKLVKLITASSDPNKEVDILVECDSSDPDIKSLGSELAKNIFVLKEEIKKKSVELSKLSDKNEKLEKSIHIEVNRLRDLFSSHQMALTSIGNDTKSLYNIVSERMEEIDNTLTENDSPIDELSANLDRIKQTLLGQTSRFEAASIYFEEISGENEILKLEKIELVSTVESLKESREIMNAQKEELIKENRESKHLAESLEASKVVLVEENQKLKDDMIILHEKCISVEQDLDNAKLCLIEKCIEHENQLLKLNGKYEVTIDDLKSTILEVHRLNRMHLEDLLTHSTVIYELKDQSAEHDRTMENERSLLEAQLAIQLENVTLLNQKYSQVLNKLDELKAESNQIYGSNLELEAKLENAVTERKALLDRCLEVEAKNTQLVEANSELKRKLDDSEAGLHELGRENQALQIENLKHRGRKWTEDSEATHCTTCGKLFSVTVRKHHCRNCGNIFCNECSSKSASVASSRKPARVCDLCFTELSK